VQNKTWALSVLAAGLLGLAAGWFLRSTRDPGMPPPASPEPKKVSDASCLADEMAARAKWLAKEGAPAETPPAAGRVRGRLTLPWQERKKSSYAYAIYAFTADGKVEGPRNFTNTDRFEIADGAAGRKAILFYPLLENLTFPYQVVDVPAAGEVEVALRPRIPYLLSGRVVDANGSGVGGVTVIVHETIGLPGDLYLAGRPATAAVVERSSEAAVSPAAPAMEDIVNTYVKIDPLAGRLSHGVTTDTKGQFRLPVTSPTDPVPVSIVRSPSEVLKEETVLPGSGELRLVVPNQ